MHNDLKEILFSHADIEARVKTLAAEITEQYRNKKLTVVFLSSGATLFAADLIRHIPLPLHLDCLSVSSYSGTSSSGTVSIAKDLKLPVSDRHILIVDDILDTGLTLSKVTEAISAKRPASLATCVLLNKEARRKISIRADFCGFQIDDHFVVGYGLDYNEHYRNLPFIGILKEEIYS